MLYKSIVTVTVVLVAVSAFAELLFPTKLLAFVGIPSHPQMDFVLRTSAAALIALLPSLSAARKSANSPASRSALFGVVVYMFLSSIVDFQALSQGIVNSMSVPSILLRVLLGFTILWLIVRGILKE